MCEAKHQVYEENLEKMKKEIVLFKIKFKIPIASRLSKTNNLQKWTPVTILTFRIVTYFKFNFKEFCLCCLDSKKVNTE